MHLYSPPLDLMCLLSTTFLLVNCLPLRSLQRNLVAKVDTSDRSLDKRQQGWHVDYGKRFVKPVVSLLPELSPSQDQFTKRHTLASSDPFEFLNYGQGADSAFYSNLLETVKRVQERGWHGKNGKRELKPVATRSSEATSSLSQYDSRHPRDHISSSDPFELLRYGLGTDIAIHPGTLAGHASDNIVAKRQQGWHNPYGKRGIYLPGDTNADNEMIYKRQQGWHNPYGKRGWKPGAYPNSKLAPSYPRFDPGEISTELIDIGPDNAAILSSNDINSEALDDSNANSNNNYNTVETQMSHGKMNYFLPSNDESSELTAPEVTKLKQQLMTLYRTSRPDSIRVGDDDGIFPSFDLVPVAEDIDSVQQGGL